MAIVNVQGLRPTTSGKTASTSRTSRGPSERTSRTKAAQKSRSAKGGQDEKSKSKSNFWDFATSLVDTAVQAVEDTVTATGNAIKGAGQAIGSVGQSAADSFDAWSDNRTAVKIEKIKAGSTAGELALEGAAICANFLGTTTDQVLQFVTDNPELVTMALTAAGVPPVGAGASAITSALQSLGAAGLEVDAADAAGTLPPSVAATGVTRSQLKLPGGKVGGGTGGMSKPLVYGGLALGGLALAAGIYAAATASAADSTARGAMRQSDGTLEALDYVRQQYGV